MVPLVPQRHAVVGDPESGEGAAWWREAEGLRSEHVPCPIR